MNKFTAGLIAGFGLLATLVYFVHYTVNSHSLVGAYALGIISTLFIGMVFWTQQLVSTWLHSSWEQKRFQSNAQENYANLLAQQKAQNEQTKGALMIAADARKAGPALPEEEGQFLVFDESVFDNLEE